MTWRSRLRWLPFLALALSAPAAQAQAVKPPAPVLQAGSLEAQNLAACYPLHEGTGTLVHDLSTTGNNVTLLNSIVWGTGQFGADVNIAANGGRYGNAASTAGWQQTSGFSLSLWVKPGNVTATQVPLACYTAEGGNAGWLISIDAANGGKIGFFTALTGGDHTLVSTTALTAGTWYHVLCTYTPGGSKKVYLNGVLDASTTTTGTIVYTHGAGGPYAVLGILKTTASGPQFPWTGELDIPSIYSVDVSGNAPLISALVADPFSGVRPFAVGSITQVGTSLVSAISLTVGAASGGTAPLAYQWQRSAYQANTWTNVGSNSTSLTDTGVASGTSYDYRVRVTDSSGTPQTVTSGTFSVATLWPVDHVNVSLSPGNWYLSGSNPAAYAQTANGGAELRFGFNGTSARLILDTSPLTAAGVPLVNSIGHAWIVDLLARTKTLTTAGTMTLATGLTAGTHQAVYQCYGVSSAYDRWTPSAAVKVLGVQLDLAASLAAPTAVPTDKTIFFGDSITEGAFAAPDGTGDNLYGYVRPLAAALSSEPTNAAFASTGWNTGASGVGNFNSQIGFYSAGKPRNLNGVFRRCVVNHGRNDFPGISATITSTLTTLRTALGPLTKVYVVTPFAGTIAADLAAGYAAYGGGVTTFALAGGITFKACTNDPNMYLIDLGALGSVGLGVGPNIYTTDGTHPSDVDHRRLAAILAGVIRSIPPESQPAAVLLGMVQGGAGWRLPVDREAILADRRRWRRAA